MQLDPEEDIMVAWRPFTEAIQMAIDGRITEVCSVAAILKVAWAKAQTRSEATSGLAIL
jgi:hypothetical protein